MKVDSELWRELDLVLKSLGTKIGEARSDLVLIDVPGKTVQHAEEILSLARRLAGLCGIPVEPDLRCNDLAARLDQTAKALADCRDSLGKSITAPALAAFLQFCISDANDHFASKGFFLARARLVLPAEGEVRLKGYLGANVYHYAGQKNPAVRYVLDTFKVIPDGERCVIEDCPENRQRIILALHERFPGGNILSWESSAFQSQGQATGAFALLGAKISLDLNDFVSLVGGTQHHEGERQDTVPQSPSERTVQTGAAPASV